MNTCCNLFSGTSFTFPLLHCAVVVCGLVLPIYIFDICGDNLLHYFVDAVSFWFCYPDCSVVTGGTQGISKTTLPLLPTFPGPVSIGPLFFSTLIHIIHLASYCFFIAFVYCFFPSLYNVISVRAETTSLIIITPSIQYRLPQQARVNE